MLTIGDRPAINMNTENASTLDVLRRLKYVYYFSREAREPTFRQAQRHAVELYIDTTVMRGRQGALDQARRAITSVINGQPSPPADPASWNDTHDKRLIEAIKAEREASAENLNDRDNIQNRAMRIENSDFLSRARITGITAQNNTWGALIQ